MRQQLSDGQVRILARGAGVAVAGRLGGRLVHVLGQLIIARLLGPQLFGRFTVGWTLLNTLGASSSLGMDRGVIRFGTQSVSAAPAEVGRVVAIAMGLAAAAGSIVAVAMFVGADWLAVEVFNSPATASVLRAFAPAFVIFAPMRVASAATRLSQRMGYSVVLESLGQPAINLLMVIAFALGGLSVMDAVLALDISLLASLIGLAWALKRLFPGAWSLANGTAPSVRRLLAFGIPAGVAGSLTLFSSRIDRLVIAHFRPEAELGLYQAASQSAILFGLLLSGLTAVLQPMVSDLHDRQDTGALDGLFKISTRWTLFACLPLYLVMALAPDHVIAGVYGPSFADASGALWVLATAQFINASTGSVGPILVMTGRQNTWAMISGAVLVLAVTLNVILVPRFGIMGAAWAAVVTTTVLFSAGLVRLRVEVGIWPYDRSFLRAIPPAAAAAVAVVALRNWTPASTVGLGILTAAVVCTFFGVLLLSGLDPDDRKVLDAVSRRLHARRRER